MNVSNMYTELGAIGFLIVGLSFVTIYLFKFVVKQMKQDQEENKTISTQFIEHLKTESQENRDIIKSNIDTVAKLIDSILMLNKTVMRSDSNIKVQNEILKEWLSEKKKQKNGR